LRGADVVIVGVGRVTSVDAATLVELVELGHDCRRRGVGLALAGLSPFTRRLLAALDPDRVTVVVDDMVAATHWAATWTQR
jgi:anti-anti-sigma regulatory factor